MAAPSTECQPNPCLKRGRKSENCNWLMSSLSVETEVILPMKGQTSSDLCRLETGTLMQAVGGLTLLRHFVDMATVIFVKSWR